MVNDMPQNRGKQFEGVIKKACERVEGVSIDRIHDQTNGYKNSSNICDFIAYKYPYEYYLECKSIHGHTFPLRNVTDNQRKGLLAKSQIHGVIAGVIIWFIDHDKTFFVPIQHIQDELDFGHTGLHIYNLDKQIWKKIEGTKKRIFFDYDMQSFFDGGW